MARPKTFDHEAALDRAVELFWRKGYEATSIQDLLDAMGIQRGSLYAAFGSKESLFLTVLDRYGEVVVSKLLALLESRPSPKASIRAFFDAVVEQSVSGGPLRGCLATNSAVEKGLEENAVRDKVARLLEGLEAGFRETLRRAREAGEIGGDPAAKARFLCGTLQGLLVIGKIRPERPLLEDIVQTALSVLD